MSNTPIHIQEHMKKNKIAFNEGRQELNGGNRWWIVRHAPVTGVEGRIYGSLDVDCDCSDPVRFEGLKSLLPEMHVTIITDLKRTRETFNALSKAGGKRIPEPIVIKDFREQNLGSWEGKTFEELEKNNPEDYKDFWERKSINRPEGGENFIEVVIRVSKAFKKIDKLHSNKDILLVAHAGTIRALLVAGLKWDPENAMMLHHANVGLTVMESNGKGKMKRLCCVNYLAGGFSWI